jgi:hypothetical protein
MAAPPFPDEARPPAAVSEVIWRCQPANRSGLAMAAIAIRAKVASRTVESGSPSVNVPRKYWKELERVVYTGV